MNIDRTIFFAEYRASVAPLAQDQVDGFNTLLDAIEADPEAPPAPQLAYVLATIERETGQTFRPIYERGPRRYFDKYEPNTRLGRMLGNTDPGDGYRFRGRGYVQVTGRSNYSSLSTAFRQDFVNNPDQLLLPNWAWGAASFGMRIGLFTGRKLRDYIDPAGPRADYYNARRIINPGELSAAPAVVETIAKNAEMLVIVLQKSIVTPAVAPEVKNEQPLP